MGTHGHPRIDMRACLRALQLGAQQVQVGLGWTGPLPSGELCLTGGPDPCI